MGFGILLNILLVKNALACQRYILQSIPGCEKNYRSPATPLYRTSVPSSTECLMACYEATGCRAVNLCPDNSHPGALTCDLFELDQTDGTCGNLSQSPDCRYMEQVVECPGVQQYDRILEECKCNPSWMTGPNCDQYYRDCTDAFEGGLTDPSDYKTIPIKPDVAQSPFDVLCLLRYDGWTQVEERNDLCPDDWRNYNWASFKNGFGNASCGFFLGLEKTYQVLQNGVFQLSVYLTGKDGLGGQAYYNNFTLGSESAKYVIKWDSYEAHHEMPAEDGFDYGGPYRTLQGNSFGTRDNPDQNNCGTSEGTGWWYGTNCPLVNLHMPLNAPPTGTEGSAAWPKDGNLKKLYYFKLQLKRIT